MTVPDPDHASGVIQFRAQFVSRQAQYWAPFAIYLRIWVLPIPYVGAVAQNVLRLWAEGFSPGLVVQRAVADRNSPGLVVQEVREKTLCTVLGRKNPGKMGGEFYYSGLRSKNLRENGWRVL
jgi:hypothetical protein